MNTISKILSTTIIFLFSISTILFSQVDYDLIREEVASIKSELELAKQNDALSSIQISNWLGQKLRRLEMKGHSGTLAEDLFHSHLDLLLEEENFSDLLFFATRYCKLYSEDYAILVEEENPNLSNQVNYNKLLYFKIYAKYRLKDFYGSLNDLNYNQNEKNIIDYTNPYIKNRYPTTAEIIKGGDFHKPYLIGMNLIGLGKIDEGLMYLISSNDSYTTLKPYEDYYFKFIPTYPIFEILYQLEVYKKFSEGIQFLNSYLKDENLANEVYSQSTLEVLYLYFGKFNLNVGNKLDGCLALSKALELGNEDALTIIKTECGR